MNDFKMTVDGLEYSVRKWANGVYMLFQLSDKTLPSYALYREDGFMERYSDLEPAYRAFKRYCA